MNVHAASFIKMVQTMLLLSRTISSNGIHLKNHRKSQSNVLLSVRWRSSNSIKLSLGSAGTINGSYRNNSFATTTPGYCFIGNPLKRSTHTNKDISSRRRALNFASPQRRILSTAVATLQNDEYEDMDDNNNNMNKRSRLQDAYDSMFEESKINIPKQNTVNVSQNQPNLEEEEQETLFGSEEEDEYIDYISSFEDQQSIQLSNNKDDVSNKSSSETEEATTPASHGDAMNTIMVNEETSAMMDDLFQDDFPASLPLSQQELKETNDMVQFNHDRYAQYHQTDPTKKIKKEVEQAPKQQVESSPSFVSSQKVPPKASSPKTLSSQNDNNDIEQANNKSQSSTTDKSSSSSSFSRLSPPPQKMNTSEKEILEFTIHQIQTQIYKLNNNEEFNIHSYKQVSKVLFGVETESTNREVLEGLTGNIVHHLDSSKNISELAKLILEFRKLHSKLKKMERAEANKANGSHVNHYNQNTFVSKQNSGENTGSDTKRSFSVAVNSNEGNSVGSGGDKSIPNELTLGHKHHQDGDTAIEPLVLVDASAYIFRAYYSMPPIHRFDGEPTGATLGFCNMLNRLVLTPSFLGQGEGEVNGKTVLPPRVVLVFDSKDATNFRKELYPEYKANRKACPVDLIPQFDFVRDAADAYGILQLEAAGYEADDVIATIATKALEEGCFVNILSGDKDLMQLVTQDEVKEMENNNWIEPCIQLIDPMNMVRVDYKGVIDKWGVEPERLGDVLALAGDTADNVPGVPGIGPKIAVSLIQEYGSLEGILANVDFIKQKARREKLKENTDIARLSRQLVELERDVPLEAMGIPSHFDSISDFRMEPFDSDRLIAFYDRMGFRDLKRRVQSRINSARKEKPKPRVTSTLGKVYDAILDGKDIDYVPPTTQKQRIPPKAAESNKIIVEDTSVLSEQNQSMGVVKGNRTRIEMAKESSLNVEDQFQNRTQYKAPPEDSEFDDVPF